MQDYQDLNQRIIAAGVGGDSQEVVALLSEDDQSYSIRKLTTGPDRRITLGDYLATFDDANYEPLALSFNQGQVASTVGSLSKIVLVDHGRSDYELTVEEIEQPGSPFTVEPPSDFTTTFPAHSDSPDQSPTIASSMPGVMIARSSAGNHTAELVLQADSAEVGHSRAISLNVDGRWYPISQEAPIAWGTVDVQPDGTVTVLTDVDGGHLYVWEVTADSDGPPSIIAELEGAVFGASSMDTSRHVVAITGGRDLHVNTLVGTDWFTRPVAPPIALTAEQHQAASGSRNIGMIPVGGNSNLWLDQSGQLLEAEEL